MFMSRLDSARSEAKAEYKTTPSKASGTSQSTKLSTIDASCENDDENLSIFYKLSEYLFDLFDANCLEDFKTIEKFEEAAIEAFENFDNQEYTLEQHKLHGEFLGLFESLIEKFLTTEGYDIDNFYEQLRGHLRKADTKNREYKSHFDEKSKLSDVDHAKEIIMVINCYTEFESWATMMKDQAKQSHQFQTFKNKIGDALKEDYGVMYGQASKHRLDI